MKETDFARYLTQFLAVYLPGHLGSKKNTQLSYRDSFSLFLAYCRDVEKLAPEKLMVSQTLLKVCRLRSSIRPTPISFFSI